MRKVPEAEVETDFERQFCWGDDERYFYNGSSWNRVGEIGQFS
jgi:hypothetical protein